MPTKRNPTRRPKNKPRIRGTKKKPGAGNQQGIDYLKKYPGTNPATRRKKTPTRKSK